MHDDIHRLLTRRELDVLDCLREGKSTREIADALHIDYETVRSHKKHIMEKLGLHSTTVLMKYIIEKYSGTSE
jgi:DNA-binding NarL/FixJ family response regulator